MAITSDIYGLVMTTGLPLSQARPSGPECKGWHRSTVGRFADSTDKMGISIHALESSSCQDLCDHSSLVSSPSTTHG